MPRARILTAVLGPTPWNLDTVGTPLFRSGSLVKFTAEGLKDENSHVWPGPRVLRFNDRLGRLAADLAGRYERNSPQETTLAAHATPGDRWTGLRNPLSLHGNARPVRGPLRTGTLTILDDELHRAAVFEGRGFVRRGQSQPALPSSPPPPGRDHHAASGRRTASGPPNGPNLALTLANASERHCVGGR
jgi:hypothetical protein